MATKDKEKEAARPDDEQPEPPGQGLVDAASLDLLRPKTEEPETEDDGAPANLGATKYVHAAFFAAGILGAYLSGKTLAAIWSRLAEWPAAVRTVPQLLRYGEEERGTITLAAGAVIGLIGVIQTYRKEHIRRWADEVALELSKVTWPNKETVTNGTIIVVVASAVAAVYIALLDRLWAFVTTLVYGA